MRARRASAHARPAIARARAVARTLSSWAGVLNVPLASTVPSASSATAYGLPGTSAAAQAPASRASSNVRSDDRGCSAKPVDRRLERAAQPAALRGEHRQRECGAGGGLVERVGQRARARRAPAPPPGSPARPAGQREPQLADLARQREHGDGQRDDAEQRDAEPDASQPSVLGSLARERAAATAKAAASARRARSTRGPRASARRSTPHGAPPRPRARTAACATVIAASSPAPAQAAADPGDDAGRERQLGERPAPPQASAAARPRSP